ncbi:MAG: phage tail protein, partial [Chloroflexi bacterium]|nr:phage tail protein [Chloroflexota bacterium]
MKVMVKFIIVAMTLVAMIATAAYLASSSAEVATAEHTDRTFTSGLRVEVSIDGKPVGFARSVEGGTIVGQVESLQIATDHHVQNKHIAAIGYEDLSLRIGLGMGKDIYKWIDESFQGVSKDPHEKQVEIIATDLNGNPLSVRGFVNARLTEVTIPALDGASKEPCYLSLVLRPDLIIYDPEGAGIIGEDPITSGLAIQKWLCSNFRFNLGSLPTGKISNIEPLTWKLSETLPDIPKEGDLPPGDVIKPSPGPCAPLPIGADPSKVQVPNLLLTISVADIGPWVEWHQSFIIDEKCTDTDELSGKLEFLAPNLLDVLGS